MYIFILCMNCSLHDAWSPTGFVLFFSFDFFRQAHLHHYTKVDGMDLGLFESAYEDLSSLVSECNGLQTNKADSLDNIVQRLKII